MKEGIHQANVSWASESHNSAQGGSCWEPGQVCVDLGAYWKGGCARPVCSDIRNYPRNYVQFQRFPRSRRPEVCLKLDEAQAGCVFQ